MRGMIETRRSIGSRAPRALVPMIEAASDRIEAERRIVPEVIAALHEAGLFRMLLPASFGGGAADIVAFNQVIETIATADASPRGAWRSRWRARRRRRISTPKSRARFLPDPTAPSPGARPRAPRRSSSTAAISSTGAGALPAAASIARGSAAIATVFEARRQAAPRQAGPAGACAPCCSARTRRRSTTSGT